jgi:hypothetical protein
VVYVQTDQPGQIGKLAGAKTGQVGVEAEIDTVQDWQIGDQVVWKAV